MFGSGAANQLTMSNKKFSQTKDAANQQHQSNKKAPLVGDKTDTSNSLNIRDNNNKENNNNIRNSKNKNSINNSNINNSNSINNNNNSSTSNDGTTSTNESASGAERFEGDGVQFKAKLIGSELVIEPRGDKICQDSIQRLKAIIRGQKAHKRRIVMKISYAGVKVLDEKTNELLYHNEVPQISFIASDDTDPRTFGYICDVPGKAHRFICFKTGGPAVQLMSVISSLFEAVLERKNAAEQQQEQSNADSSTASSSASASAAPTASDRRPSERMASTTASDETTTTVGGGLLAGSFEAPTSAAAAAAEESDYLEFGYGSIAEPAALMNAKGAAPEPKQQLKSNKASFDLFDGQLNELFIGAPPAAAAAQQPPGSLGNDFGAQLRWDQAQQQHREPALVKQSTLRSDSFGGALSLTGDSGILDSPNAEWSSSTADSPVVQQQQQQASPFDMQRAARLPPPSQPISLQRPPAGSRRQHQHQLQQQVFASQAQMSPSSGGLLQSASVKPSTGFMVAPTSDDPFAVPPASQPGAPHLHNRSLIYNHSSVSLNEAALTRQPSLQNVAPNNTPASGPLFLATSGPGQRSAVPISSGGGTDKYAVFNDIDNLPSIFESSTTPTLSSSLQAAPMSGQLVGSAFGSGSGQPQLVSHSQMNSLHQRFASSAAAASTMRSSMATNSMAQAAAAPPFTQQRFAGSSAGANSSASGGDLSRPINPFDDDFFAQ